MKIRKKLIVAALFMSGIAAAQEKEEDAERLFREGQKLLEEHRYGEACPKFEAAYRKDHQLGTLLNLAYCHKEQGATWLAWLEFREAELRAIELKRNDRRDFAAKARAPLEKSLAKVVIDNPGKIELTEVLVDDRHVPEGEAGSVFAAEPGERKFLFRAKGKKPTTLLVRVAKGPRPQHVLVPEMIDKGPEDAPPPAPVVVAPAPVEKEKPPPEAPRPAEKTEGSTQRTLGWVALGTGGAALAAGAVTGLMTITSSCAKLGWDENECNDSVRSRDDTTQMISTVAFVVAGAGIASGLVLLATAPKNKVDEGAKRARSAPPAERGKLRVVPEIGAGWAGMRGTF